MDNNNNDVDDNNVAAVADDDEIDREEETKKLNVWSLIIRRRDVSEWHFDKFEDLPSE